MWYSEQTVKPRDQLPNQSPDKSHVNKSLDQRMIHHPHSSTRETQVAGPVIGLVCNKPCDTPRTPTRILSLSSDNDLATQDRTLNHNIVHDPTRARLLSIRV